MMGMIKRSVCYKAPIDVTSYLYSTLVLSNLEHCSTVWCSFNLNEMQALESIQRAATRYILHYPDVKYSERCTTQIYTTNLFVQPAQIASFAQALKTSFR